MNLDEFTDALKPPSPTPDVCLLDMELSLASWRAHVCVYVCVREPGCDCVCACP